MPLSVIIPYHWMEDAVNLRNCLRTIAEQTVLPHEVIIVDDSQPYKLSVITAVLRPFYRKFKISFEHLPYREKPQWSRKFNTAFEMVTGSTILLLCANWLLAKYALEVMERAADAMGPGNIALSDSQRQQMCDTQGRPVDWYADQAAAITGEQRVGIPYLGGDFSIFPVLENPSTGLQDFNQIDVGYFQAIHKEDWLHWDEDFDEVGSWHSVVEWGYRHVHKEQHKLWIVRGLLGWHQPAGFTHNPGDWQAQTRASQRLMAQKIPGFPAE